MAPTRGSKRPGGRRCCAVARPVASDVAVELDKVSVRLGPEEILSDVNLKVPSGARAVVVGPNGSGKTTLLSVIAGLVSEAEGNVEVTARSVGWLQQEAVGSSRLTVFDEAVSQMEVTAVGRQLKEAEATLAQASGEDLETAQAAYDMAQERFEGLGGYSLESQVAGVLTGLSFDRGDFRRPCSELSGGWQMRVALARTLLSDPELMLLDEPTNHMDASAKQWLANYLATGLSPNTTMMLVTHDRAFLEAIKCSCVVEISAKRLFLYPCMDILQWERTRLTKATKLQKEILKLESSVAQNRDYISRFGAKASHAASAQSRLKQVEGMERQINDLRDALVGLPDTMKKKNGEEEPMADGTLPLASKGRMRLQLPAAPLSGGEMPREGVLLGLSQADIGYDGEKDGTPIVGQVSANFVAGSRSALIGPNGCGKTTILRSLDGSLPLLKGLRRLGASGLRRARVRLFTQDLAQILPGDVTPVDYILGDDAPISLDPQAARAALGSLGLRSEVHMSKISTLSGGEKARVALAFFTTRPADVLLLDEPTNHLDGAAVAALAAGLRAHTGGVVIVASHDKAFVQELEVNQTLSVIRSDTPGEPSMLKLEECAPRRDSWSDSARPRASNSSVEVDDAAAALEDAGSSKRRHRNGYGFSQAEKLMRKIEKKEASLEKAEQKMNDSYNEKNLANYERVKAQVEELYEQWEALEESTAAVAG